MLRRNWWNLLRARRKVPRLGALGRCSRLPCPNRRRPPHVRWRADAAHLLPASRAGSGRLGVLCSGNGVSKASQPVRKEVRICTECQLSARHPCRVPVIGFLCLNASFSPAPKKSQRAYTQPALARGMRRAPGEAGAKHDMQRTSAPTTAAQSDGGSPAPLVEDTVEGLLLAVQHSRGRQPAGGEVAGSADTATTSALEPCPPPGPAPGRHDAAGDGEGRSVSILHHRS